MNGVYSSIKKTARRVGRGGLMIVAIGDGSDHLLQALERAHLDDVVGGLGLEHHLFAGEGVDTLACRTAGLVLLDDLHESGNREGTGATTTDLFLDETSHGLEDRCDFGVRPVSSEMLPKIWVLVSGFTSVADFLVFLVFFLPWIRILSSEWA